MSNGPPIVNTYNEISVQWASRVAYVDDVWQKKIKHELGRYNCKASIQTLMRNCKDFL